MPWKEVTTMETKEAFVELAQGSEVNVSALCKRFGISRKTGYKLLKRFKEEGLAGLKLRSRKPRSHSKKVPSVLENLILEMRKLYPQWGGEKLRQRLLNQGHQNLPTEKTIDRLLKRHGLIAAEESEKRKAWQRFEHEKPNDLWQMDFKGHIPLQEGRCHPLTLLDDHSRFALPMKACGNEQAETVKEHLIAVFREYGLPQGMTMDNGTPWGYSGAQLHTHLTAWIIRLGIYVSHSRPNHPQTQGKLERFHRTLKLELLENYSFANLHEAQEGFDWWRRRYNEERPHAALGLAVPLKRYQKSERPYPAILSPIEYDKSFVVRKVQQGGLIHWQGKIFRVGDAFRGQPIGLKEGEEEGLIDVYYCHQKVNKIDLRYSYK